MVRLTLGQQGPELLPDGIDEVRLECGHEVCSFELGRVRHSQHDRAIRARLHAHTLPIGGSSKGLRARVVSRGKWSRTMTFSTSLIFPANRRKRRADERTRTADLLITSVRSVVAGVCTGLHIPHK